MQKGARVGLVGCGTWGRLVLRDLVALGSDVTVAVRSPEGKAAALEGGAVDVVNLLDDLPEVEGIVVVTPVGTHAHVVEGALERNVPVFVEKPLTNDLVSADRLAVAAPDRLFVMDKWRYHPGVELLAEIARGGELGAVVGLRTSRLGWGNPHDVDAVWVLAPHELSIGLEILGEVHAPRTAVADSVDGHAFGLFGLLGHHPWHALEISTRSADRRREVSLVCEAGVAVLPDAYSDAVRIFTSDDATKKTAPPEPELRPISSELPLLRELAAFLEHLDGGPPPRSSAAEGAAIVRAITELRALAGLDA